MTSASNFDDLPSDERDQIARALLTLMGQMTAFQDTVKLLELELQFLNGDSRHTIRDGTASQAQAFMRLAANSTAIAETLNELADINQQLIDQGYT